VISSEFYQFTNRKVWGKGIFRSACVICVDLCSGFFKFYYFREK